MKIQYKPSFLRQLKKLPPALIDDVEERLELFQKNPNHTSLKIHTLKGRLSSFYSFSVNYAYRIIFQYEDNGKTATMLFIGGHDVYKQ